MASRRSARRSGRLNDLRRVLQRPEMEDAGMKTSIVAIAATLALAAAQTAVAQQAQDAPNVRTAPALAVSDAELETFATIYVDLLETAAKFQAEMNSAATEEQAGEIRGRAQTESVAKVEQRGWTPEKFNSVSEAINNDPALTDKAVKLIEER
jgi:hypothetical protein